MPFLPRDVIEALYSAPTLTFTISHNSDRSVYFYLARRVIAAETVASSREEFL